LAERELLLAVRRGEWSEDHVIQHHGFDLDVANLIDRQKHANRLFKTLEESAVVSPYLKS